MEELQYTTPVWDETLEGLDIDYLGIAAHRALEAGMDANSIEQILTDKQLSEDEKLDIINENARAYGASTEGQANFDRLPNKQEPVLKRILYCAHVIVGDVAPDRANSRQVEEALIASEARHEVERILTSYGCTEDDVGETVLTVSEFVTNLLRVYTRGGWIFLGINTLNELVLSSHGLGNVRPPDPTATDDPEGSGRGLELCFAFGETGKYPRNRNKPSDAWKLHWVRTNPELTEVLGRCVDECLV